MVTTGISGLFACESNNLHVTLSITLYLTLIELKYLNLLLLSAHKRGSSWPTS